MKLLDDKIQLWWKASARCPYKICRCWPFIVWMGLGPSSWFSQFGTLRSMSMQNTSYLRHFPHEMKLVPLASRIIQCSRIIINLPILPKWMFLRVGFICRVLISNKTLSEYNALCIVPTTKLTVSRCGYHSAIGYLSS